MNQPFLGALGIRRFADEADAFERLVIDARHAGAFELEPAVGTIGVLKTEF